MLVPTTKIFVITAFGDQLSTEARERNIYEHRNLISNRILDPVKDRFRNSIDHNVIFEIGSDDPQNIDLYSKIMESIYNADMVLAIIFEHKPNLYLEMGWSQAFWHKTMFLKRSDVSLPGDVLGHEFLEYKADCFETGNELLLAYVQDQLYARILANMKPPRRKPPHFLEMRSAVAAGAVTMYNRFSKGVTPGEWVDTLESAEKFIIMCVPKLYKIDDQAFSITSEGHSRLLGQILLDAALRGVHVTVLMSHPDSYASWHFPSKYVSRDPEDEQNRLRKVYNKWKTGPISEYARKIENKQYCGLTPDGFRIIGVKNRYLPYRVSITERRAITTLRFYSEQYNSMHCIDAPAPMESEKKDPYNQSIYSTILNEMNFLIRENDG